MIGVTIAKDHYSGELVRSNKQLVLTIPGKEAAQALLQCGSKSGRDVDKIREFGLNMQSLETTEIRIPEHTKLAIQCSVKEYVEVGDHYFYICNVEEVYADESKEALFGWDGYSKVATAKKGDC